MEEMIQEGTDYEPSDLPPLMEQELSEALLRGEDVSEQAETPEPTPSREGEPEPATEAPLAIDYAELERAAAQEDGTDELLKDFKELTPSEYRELLDEDPDAASLYLYESRLHQESQKKRTAAKNLTQKVIEEAAQEIRKIIPDIYSNSPKEAAALADFAVKHGIDGRVLETLTRPDTRIQVPGGKSFVLGKGAASLVRMLANLAKTSPEGRSKAQSSGARSQAARSGKARISGLQAEADYAGMTEAQREEYLKG